jgi:Glycosyl transferases group 1
VVVTSEWTRQQVLTRYAIPAHRVHVARPGVHRVTAPARPVRGHLICVGVLGRHKGQDLLVEALAELAERDWHCVLAGPLDRDPDFVDQLQTRITRLGYGHRVRLTGVLTGAALSHAYTTADLLVAPSRSEAYGMTVTEALAHGLPVIAAAVGGLPEALGFTVDGTRSGQLVPPGDPAALAAALGDWLGDERHRHRLRAAARQRRSTLRGWEQTTQEIANALAPAASMAAATWRARAGGDRVGVHEDPGERGGVHLAGDGQRGVRRADGQDDVRPPGQVGGLARGIRAGRRGQPGRGGPGLGGRAAPSRHPQHPVPAAGQAAGHGRAHLTGMQQPDQRLAHPPSVAWRGPRPPSRARTTAATRPGRCSAGQGGAGRAAACTGYRAARRTPPGRRLPGRAVSG